MKRRAKISANVNGTKVVIDFSVITERGMLFMRREVNEMYDCVMDDIVDLIRYKIPRFNPHFTDVRVGKA